MAKDAALQQLLSTNRLMAYELSRLEPEGQEIARGYLERLMKCEDTDRALMLLNVMEAELCAYLERRLVGDLQLNAPHDGQGSA